MLNFDHVEVFVSTNSSSRIIRFSAFEVNLQTGELRKRGQKIKLQEQPLQVLAALLEQPGEVVTREELRSKLWPADTFVDFEHGLNAAIRRLRDALGESAETPIFVETVPRRGYRFIVNIETSVTADRSAPTGPQPWPPVARKAAFGVLVACALVLSFLYYRRAFMSKGGQPTAMPAVTDVGEKYTPNLSPDGQHLAFAWNGGTGQDFSIYVKLVGTEESLRLTKKASIDFNPVWSPDGRYIAYCRILEGATGIYIIPASGGAERRVRTTLWEDQEFYEIFWVAGHLSWSPDGKSLAYSDHAARGEGASIFILSLDSLQVHRLTSPTRSSSDFNPEFSPDGHTLAFVRVSQVSSIFTIPVSGGEEQRLFSNNRSKRGLAWTPDGHNLVFANVDGLWKITSRGGEPERLQVGHDGVEPSIRGNRLAYVQRTTSVNIWRRSLNPSASGKFPDKFMASTRMQSGPQFSPDGSKITFESTRSGDYEIWVCQSDASSLMQLTHFSPSQAGTPRWSPDGQQIIFDARPAGQVDIYAVDSQGGPLRRLTQEPSNENVPSWSRDGRWIYYASDRTGGWEVWKMPSTGGPAVQVTHHGGFAPLESPNGKFLYYAKGLTLPGIWRISADGGVEAEVISSLRAGYWGYWAVGKNGIYYLDMTKKPGIAFFDIPTQRSTRVFDLDSRPVREVSGLAISPDEKTILYTQLDSSNSDIILVENFR